MPADLYHSMVCLHVFFSHFTDEGKGTWRHSKFYTGGFWRTASIAIKTIVSSLVGVGNPSPPGETETGGLKIQGCLDYRTSSSLS